MSWAESFPKLYFPHDQWPDCKDEDLDHTSGKNLGKSLSVSSGSAAGFGLVLFGFFFCF